MNEEVKTEVKRRGRPPGSGAKDKLLKQISQVQASTREEKRVTTKTVEPKVTPTTSKNEVSKTSAKTVTRIVAKVVQTYESSIILEVAGVKDPVRLSTSSFLSWVIENGYSPKVGLVLHGYISDTGYLVISRE